MLSKILTVLKSAVVGYIDDGCLGRGAAIAYYTVFSLAPVLIIIIAIAAIAFGEDAARGAIVSQISDLMGKQGAEAVQTMIASAGGHGNGALGGLVGTVVLIVTASGVFSEMQAALNAIWKAQPKTGTISRLVRARLASLGLVVALGFLLLVSLVVSAALSAMGTWLNGLFPEAHLVLQALSFAISLLLIAILFGVIYKVLPDTFVPWQDVAVGSLVTAVLFNIGKTLISLYLGSSTVASSFGAAGALALLLLWIYYSAQIFLFGA
jgi:membrane protein